MHSTDTRYAGARFKVGSCTGASLKTNLTDAPSSHSDTIIQTPGTLSGAG